ncbi:hypothetical protein TNCV_1831121 [Trichonephila clavipes]|nr:hypothetical protein TNCV_1831121 [Trichonephila clavipes]
MASKVLGVCWNEKSDTFYFDSSDLGTFLSKRINTKDICYKPQVDYFRLKHSTLSDQIAKGNVKGARNILKNGTKFASPTEFKSRMELHSTRFSPFRWIVGQTLSP